MSQLSDGARELAPSHISIRVPWHDDCWKGTVCASPCLNASCLVLKNIHENKNDQKEKSIAGRRWDEIGPDLLPACASERGAFMAPFEYTRTLKHPYFGASKLHDHFEPTPYIHAPYSASCIPFRWMLTAETDTIAEEHGIGFQHELEEKITKEMGFGTSWLQTRRNQLAMLGTFFSAIRPKESLCFFYAKQTPLVEDPRRIIVGIGRVVSVGEPVEFNYAKHWKEMHRSMAWERNVQHSIRPDFADGFLFPYHELQELAERDPSIDISDCVAFAPESTWAEFSFGSELVGHDAAIAALLVCSKSLHRIGEVLPGNWQKALKWVDAEINRLWSMRGPCPGLGSALTAFGLSNGSLIAHEIGKSQVEAHAEWNEDPWPLVDQVFTDPSILGPVAKRSISATLREKWQLLPTERKQLLQLLSRFSLTSAQATRFFQPTERTKVGITVSDLDIITNPYLIYELDRGRIDAITVDIVDRGMFPDQIVRQKHPLPTPSALEGDDDPRRVRALIIRNLDKAASQGHTLQPRTQVIQSIRDLPLDPPCPVDADLLAIVESHFADEIVKVEMGDGSPAYQLGSLHAAGKIIRSTVERRLKGARHTGDYPWNDLLNQVFEASRRLDSLPPEERIQEESARNEKACALAELFASRISVLIGPAGTGKTTLLKILCDLQHIRDGVCLLAPTGKARVRMEQLLGVKGAQTIAQFLLPLGRYNAETGAYLMSDSPKRKGVQTLIIDEASMLTEEQIAAVLDAIEPPSRIILVGDPKQLPPIGSGRPFLDIVRRLSPSDLASRFPKVGSGYAELTIRRRQVGEKRDDLLLAEWFGGESPGPGCDEIWDKLGRGFDSPTISLQQWDTEEELNSKLLDCLVKELGLKSSADQLGFEQSYGGKEINGRCYFNQRRGEEPGAGELAESWQILTPRRGSTSGVDALNRFIKESFRSQVREFALQKWRQIPKPKGLEGILYGDKVINNTNKSRKNVYPEDGAMKYVANGEIGVVVGHFKKKDSKYKGLPKDLEVEFSSQSGYKYTFWNSDFSDEGEVKLSLAYALTVHKTQGSEFGKTFVVLPKHCRMLSRELLYTALTRQKEKIVILYQGEFYDLREYTDPYYSEAARRLTNLFEAPKLVAFREKFFEEGLIHKTRRGEAVRSKSEVIIADLLLSKNLPYKYEKELLGSDGSRRYPDFTIEDEEMGVNYYWEHLGMLRDPNYRASWETKLEWYRSQGILPLEENGGANGTLVITKDDPNGGIDSAAIEKLVTKVFAV
ncbi:putative protein [Geobacter sp. OR-1]|uniref:AAA family ATPase n=1 Tax=Geobacter sp. OR-1 TaxID=1266765 RepID=UPI0005444EBD|nr:AAA family ATPase [Geobacter sp. OR-1]GAM10432.1 putative protein [Geobacter sp. OR-1]